MTTSPILLSSPICMWLARSLMTIDWDSAERGDVGTAESWEKDGEEFREALGDLHDAVSTGIGDDAIDGSVIADSLGRMSRIERRWGDDPQTDRARRMISGALGWEGWEVGARDLLEMLRAGEE